MLALMLTLQLAAIGEPHGIHLLPDGALDQAPVNENPWLMGGRPVIESRLREITLKLAQLPTTVSGATVVTGALAVSIGGLSSLTGFLLAVASAASPLSGGSGMLVAGAVMLSLGLFMVGLGIIVLMMGNAEVDEARGEREKLHESRRVLELALDRLNRRADAPTTFAPMATVARF